MVKRLKRGLAPANETARLFDGSSVANGERRSMSRMSRLTEATLAMSTAPSDVCGPSEAIPARLIDDAVTTMSPVVPTSIGRSYGDPTDSWMSVTVELPCVEATATVYGPPERKPATLNTPDELVTARDTVPDGTLVIVTCAPETGAPAAVTVPRSRAVVS